MGNNFKNKTPKEQIIWFKINEDIKINDFKEFTSKIFKATINKKKKV